MTILDTERRVFPSGKDQPIRGITLREHFAGLALQGIAAEAAGGTDPGLTPRAAAELAVRFADALIEKLAESR